MISLSDRMKQYEEVYDIKLMRRCPIILRCDGRAFSKLTKKLNKPNIPFMEIMANTAYNVAKDLETCVFAYSQSDEISFLLKNDQSKLSQPLFDNRLQKMISIVASEATYHFNKLSTLNLGKATFDCRAFSLPSLQEVVNCFIFRQRDCIRNSISTIADSELSNKFGTKERMKLLHGKDTKQRIQLLYDQCGKDIWKDFNNAYLKGVAIYKKEEVCSNKHGEFTRNRWFMDYNIMEFEKDSSIIIKAYDYYKEE